MNNTLPAKAGIQLGELGGSMNQIFCFKLLILTVVIFISSNIKSEELIAGKFPIIQQIDTTFSFDDAQKAYIELYIQSLKGDSLYCLKCDNYWHADYNPDDLYDFSGEFECYLKSLQTPDKVANLLTENPNQTSDWDSVRARYFSMDLKPEWINYPDYGRIRTFKLKGMQLILIMRDIEFAPDSLVGRRLSSYDFQIIILPNPSAMTDIAESSKFIKPLYFNRTSTDDDLSKYVDVKINDLDHVKEIIPRELVILAAKNGFSQINNYYTEMPVNGTAPFLWGVNKEKNQDLSVVFWCYDRYELPSNNKYHLIYAERNKWDEDLYVNKIFEFPICKDLMPFDDTTFVSDSFRYVDEYNKFYPEKIHVSPIAFKVLGDGDEFIITYYDSLWLMYEPYDW